MNRTLPYTLFLLLLLASYTCQVKAFDGSSTDVSGGKPTEQQNKTISSWDLGFRMPIWIFSQGQVGFSARAGHLKLDNESGTRLGLGAFWEKELGCFSLSIPVGVVWLDKAIFGRHQHNTKHYGGKLQFTYGGELGYKFSEDWKIFYRFEHMSNAYRYKYNPALDSHNIGIRFTF